MPSKKQVLVEKVKNYQVRVESFHPYFESILFNYLYWKPSRNTMFKVQVPNYIMKNVL